ncbi:MAG TPA: selenocysteine-specific translation elongation factor [Phycisphaerae bacterium]|nr:selenocysteine-specific translation elongation factor [Phycisphaerae bacterium]
MEARSAAAGGDGGGSRHLIIGTAGHIDHGKTALVKALTGTDTDRLPEEKRRGVTIELGFAQLVAGPYQFGVVDVPGHERFVRTMVAGATGIDLALLVVAADDSVMPQTIEHVEILDLLGVDRCVVAITKCDLADEELVALVEDDVAGLLEGTSLAGAAMVPVSATAGTGLDELRAALIAAASDLVERRHSGPFRLAIDRVFTIQGRGTVVTGSVLRGRVSAGEALELWPNGETCRVRGLASHGEFLDMVEGGQRAALNLIGVNRDQITRGCELATPGYVKPTGLLDVRVRCLPTAVRPIKSQARARLCLGTREVVARVVTSSGDPLTHGQQGYAQLRLSEPVTAVYGQRFILRDETNTRTIGGGVVLRCSDKRRRIRQAGELAALTKLDRGDATERVEEVLRFAGFTQPDDLTVAAHAGVEPGEVPTILKELAEAGRLVPIEQGGQQVVVSALDSLAGRAIRWLERFHQNNPDEPGVQQDVFIGYLNRKSKRGLGRPLLDRMVRAKQVKVRGRYVCHPDYAPSLSVQDERFLAEMLAEFEAGGFQPPSLSELKVAVRANAQRIERLVKFAVANQHLVEIDGTIFLHAAHEEALRRRVQEMIEGGSDGSVSAIRQELGSSRKYVVPFLEYLDRIGFTRREGDRRVLCQGESS